METFKQYYKFPLKTDDYCLIKVFTNDNKMAFDWLYGISSKEKQIILDIINGINHIITPSQEFYNLNNDIYSRILEGDEKGKEYPLLRIRGWGMLTGIGGYNLDADTALLYQSQFADYCVKRLNNK